MTGKNKKIDNNKENKYNRIDSKRRCKKHQKGKKEEDEEKYKF